MKIANRTIKMDIPKLLYHATFGNRVASILEKGLIPRFMPLWDNCQSGVYLADDNYAAESFCEAVIDDLPEDTEEDIDDIVVFVIDTSKLELPKFECDPHVFLGVGEQNHTWIYRGAIPLSAIVNLDNIKGGLKI